MPFCASISSRRCGDAPSSKIATVQQQCAPPDHDATTSSSVPSASRSIVLPMYSSVPLVHMGRPSDPTREVFSYTRSPSIVTIARSSISFGS